MSAPLGEFVPGHMPTQLREYWVHGKGALKIKWGVPHDFDRCVRELRKYFPTNPKGLCNILHREALGVAPGQEHAVDVFDHSECTEEFCLAPLHKGPCKGFKRGGGIHAPHVGGGHHDSPAKKATKAVKKAVPAKGGFPRTEHGAAIPDQINGITSILAKMEKTLGSDRRKWSPKDRSEERMLKQRRRDLQLQLRKAAAGIEELAMADDNERDTCPEGQHMMPNGECMDDDDESMYALMSAKDINDLPDSAFAYIEPGGSKDADGKTVPRSLRHFPIHDAAHVRNALARASESPFGAKALAKIHKAAKKMGVGDYAIEDAEIYALAPKKEGWRGMIAPIDKPTGDGRRFAPGALSHRDLPLPFRFQRSAEDGHKGAVTVGRITDIDIRDDGVYAEGDWMDSAIVPEVAEAQLLMKQQVLGASVDLDEFQFEARHKATGERFSPDQHCKDGTCEAQEAYVTNGRISAATGVGIPAFAESAKLEMFEVIDEDAMRAAFAADGFDLDDESCGCGEDEPESVTAAAVVIELPSAAVFARQESEMVGFTARGEQLFGYVADRNTCHTEYKGTCRRPPLEDDYGMFHRYLTETDQGLMAVGRFTVGYGNFVGKCGCCNADDHACSYLNAVDTIAHYDQLDRVVDARVGVDDRGIWWAGTWAAGATDAAKKIVAERGMSGDWRMVNGQLKLVEVMGVSLTRPAFPVGGIKDGRQLSLVAAAPAIPPPADPLANLSTMVDQAVAAAVAKDRRRLEVAWMVQGLGMQRTEFNRQERDRLLELLSQEA